MGGVFLWPTEKNNIRMNVKSGDMAICVKSALGLNIGRIVEVCTLLGNHSLYGPIWRCRSKEELVSEYGAVGHFMDFADDWLRPYVEPLPIIQGELKVAA